MVLIGVVRMIVAWSGALGDPDKNASDRALVCMPGTYVYVGQELTGM